MVCLDNSSYYLNIVIYVDLAAFLIVCLPQYTRMSNLVASVNFAVVALAIYSALLPDYVPADTLPLFSLNASFILFFFLVFDAVGTIAFVFLSVILLGPVALVARTHVQYWFQAQFSVDIPDSTLAIGAAVACLLAVYIYSVAENSTSVNRVVSSVVYSILVAIGIRTLWIQTDRSESVYDPVCCGTDYPDKYCPFILNSTFFFLLILLIVLRLTLTNSWNRTPEKKKPEEPEEYQAVSTVDVDSPVSVTPRRLPRRWDRFF